MTYAERFVLTIIASILFGAFEQASAISLMNENLASHATDPLDGGFFALNPAATSNAKSLVEFARMQNQLKNSVETGASGDGEERKVSKADAHNFFGGKSSLGEGVSIGVVGQISGRDLTAESEGSRSILEETHRLRSVTSVFDLDLSPNFRVGFSYRMAEIKSDVRGNWNIGADDSSEYRVIYSGYGLGLAFDNGQVHLGGLYIPPGRGKATVDSEAKLLSNPGISGVDVGYRVSPVWTIAASLYQWSYRADDARTPTTSPQNQREIALYGLDLEEFCFPMETRKLGTSIHLLPSVRLRASLIQSRLVFDGSEGGIPSDSNERTRTIQSQTILIGLRGIRGQGFGEVSLGRNSASSSALTDAGNWFGSRDYHDFEVESSLISVSLGTAI